MDASEPPLPPRETRSRRRRLAERIVFVVLPAMVVSAILGWMWFGTWRSDAVPSDVRDEARRYCSVATAASGAHEEGTPEFDRCVSDWIAILWD